MNKRADSGVLMNTIVPLALVVCALFSMLLLQNQSLKIARERAYDRLSERAAFQVTLIGETFAGKYAVLNTSASLVPEALAYGSGALSSVLSATAESGSFSSVGYASANGDTVLDSGRTTNIADRSYFQTSLLGSRAMSRIAQGTGKVLTDARFILSVPIKADGVIEGVLFGSFLDESFRALLADDAKDEDYSFICDSSGALLIHSAHTAMPVEFDNFNDLLAGAVNEDASGVAGDIASARAGSVSFKLADYEGYAVYIPLDVSDWMLVNLVSGEVIKADMRTTTTVGSVSIFIVLAVSLALVAVLVVSSSRRAEFIRERQRQEVSALTFKAETDSLTGLLNHRATRSRIERFLSGEGLGGKHALYVIDLDGFKRVNDVYGHPEGDRTIARKAENIRRVFRASDIAGRMGGDEFMVLLKNAESDAVVEKKASDLCRALEVEYGEQIELTASVGVAVSSPGKSFSQLYEEADEALYEAKRSGKAKFVIAK